MLKALPFISLLNWEVGSNVAWNAKRFQSLMVLLCSSLLNSQGVEKKTYVLLHFSKMRSFNDWEFIALFLYVLSRRHEYLICVEFKTTVKRNWISSLNVDIVFVKSTNMLQSWIGYGWRRDMITSWITYNYWVWSYRKCLGILFKASSD